MALYTLNDVCSLSFQIYQFVFLTNLLALMACCLEAPSF
jgi:hypothetical protein